MRAIGAALLLLAVAAACTKTPEPNARRNPEVRISSASLFDAGRFAGRWHVLQSYTPGCAGAAQDWQNAAPGGYMLAGVDCTGAAPAVLTGRAVVTGPGGRITPDAGFGRDPVFVLWVDQDYRMAALGTPSGRWGMILSRDPAGRADLTRAAREVLAFNGYDLTQLATR